MEQLNAEWREGFLFVGNHTILDLINTKPMMDGSPRELLVNWQAVVRWFQMAKILERVQAQSLAQKWDGTPQAEAFVKDLRQFREGLRRAVIAFEARQPAPRKDIEALNRLLCAHRTYPKLFESDGQLQRVESFESKRPEDLFSPLARAAAELLVDTDLSRVRQCENCILHFHDTSKNATRRWCSMHLCGNRAKVAAYAQRKRNRAPAYS
ncbi:MAG: CGNR zinc finger domain-containing protein [Bryobacteraceae bacterium]